MINGYNFKLIRQYVEGFKELIDTAYIGMEEEWFYSAATIFDEGEYTRDISTEGRKIDGVSGSPWATPILMIRFKDGTEAIFDCGTIDRDQWLGMDRPLKETHPSADWVQKLPRFQLVETSSD